MCYTSRQSEFPVLPPYCLYGFSWEVSEEATGVEQVIHSWGTLFCLMEGWLYLLTSQASLPLSDILPSLHVSVLSHCPSLSMGRSGVMVSLTFSCVFPPPAILMTWTALLTLPTCLHSKTCLEFESPPQGSSSTPLTYKVSFSGSNQVHNTHFPAFVP